MVQSVHIEVAASLATSLELQCDLHVSRVRANGC
jgi:hypothetical protein